MDTSIRDLAPIGTATASRSPAAERRPHRRAGELLAGALSRSGWTTATLHRVESGQCQTTENGTAVPGRWETRT